MVRKTQRIMSVLYRYWILLVAHGSKFARLELCSSNVRLFYKVLKFARRAPRSRRAMIRFRIRLYLAHRLSLNHLTRAVIAGTTQCKLGISKRWVIIMYICHDSLGISTINSVYWRRVSIAIWYFRCSILCQSWVMNALRQSAPRFGRH